MAKYNYKEFASLIGLEPKHISTYIKRGKIVADETKQSIDSENSINKLLIEKRRGKQTEKELVAELAKLEAAGKDPDFEPVHIPDDAHTAKLRELVAQVKGDGSKIPLLDESTRLLKHLDTLKRKEEIEYLQLKKEKMKGEMVPSALMQPVMMQHNHYMVSEFKNAADDFIRVFSQKKALTGEEMASIKGNFTKIINEAMLRATAATVKAMEGIVDNFAESRGKGERA